MIRLLISYGADPTPAMLGAVKANNTDLVKFLMEKGASVMDSDLMNAATENGNFVLVELFVENGTNPNDGNHHGFSSLLYNFNHSNILLL